MKMSDFVPNNRHLREVLIFFFHSKKTATEAHRELQKVYGDAALSETTCRDWLHCFKNGDFDVDDRPREGRPKTFEDADVIYYELLKPNKTITEERHQTVSPATFDSGRGFGHGQTCLSVSSPSVVFCQC